MVSQGRIQVYEVRYYTERVLVHGKEFGFIISVTTIHWPWREKRHHGSGTLMTTSIKMRKFRGRAS